MRQDSKMRRFKTLDAFDFKCLGKEREFEINLKKLVGAMVKCQLSRFERGIGCSTAVGSNPARCSDFFVLSLLSVVRP